MLWLSVDIYTFLSIRLFSLSVMSLGDLIFTVIRSQVQVKCLPCDKKAAFTIQNSSSKEY